MYIKNFLSILVFCSLSLAASEVLNSEDEELTSFNTSQLHLGQDEGVESFGLQIRLGEKDDMIYPNLLWHYRMGCRNFEILHQGLSESQAKKIKMFYDRVIDNCSLNALTQQEGSEFASTLPSSLKWILQLTDRQILCLHKPLAEILSERTSALRLPSCTYSGFDPNVPVGFWPQTDEQLIYRSSINYEQSVSLLNRTSSGDAEISNAAHIATFTTMDAAVPFTAEMVREQLPMMGVLRKSVNYAINHASKYNRTVCQNFLSLSVDIFKLNPNIRFGNNYIYFPIPKSGWSTISRALGSHEINRIIDFPAHYELGLFSADLAKSLQSKPYVFTCVRDPYYRILSGFLDKVDRGDENFYRDDLGLPKNQKILFSDFLKALKNGFTHNVDIHFRPQKHLIMSSIISCDKIVHLEKFSEEFQEVIDFLGLPGKPNDYKYDEHATKASVKLSEHYTQECIDLVLEIYKEDFEYFGYSKIPNFSLTTQDAVQDAHLRDLSYCGNHGKFVLESGYRYKEPNHDGRWLVEGEAILTFKPSETFQSYFIKLLGWPYKPIASYDWNLMCIDDEQIIQTTKDESGYSFFLSSNKERTIILRMPANRPIDYGKTDARNLSFFLKDIIVTGQNYV